MPTTEPKCPECAAVGIEKIVSADSTELSRGGDCWYDVVLCNDCGHVYGVFAKHVLTHTIATARKIS